MIEIHAVSKSFMYHYDFYRMEDSVYLDRQQYKSRHLTIRVPCLKLKKK